jgi:pantoate--beta-alanine ligase
VNIFEQTNSLQAHLNALKQNGKTVGFVPTMGALHDGHCSLIREAKEVCDVVVCSIFVNPTQFNETSDFSNYPRTIDADIDILERENCDILFHPSHKEVYPKNIAPTDFDFGKLELVMEGEHRPGHFKGVAMVVKRLFEMVQPDQAFFGLKDYQQFLIIRELTNQLSLSIKITGCPIVRENSGLAMSSRNQHLSEQQKEGATVLHRMLHDLKQNTEKESVALEKQKITAAVTQAGLEIEYIEIADANSLQPISDWDSTRPTNAFIAAFTGPVRLIDNMIIFA